MEPGAVRLLHVIPGMSREWGGSAVGLTGLATALLRSGVHSEIATTIGRRVGTNLLPTPHISVHCFDTEFPARFWTAYSRPLARFLDDAVAGFDVVHIHTPWHYPALAASRVARKHGVPYVVSPRGGLNGPALRYRRLRKWVYRKLVLDRVLQSADTLHAVTQAEQTQIVRLGYEKPVFVSPNGISLDQVDDFSSVRTSEFLATYPRLAGKRVILFLGRIHSQKGLDRLARAFARITPEFDDAALLVAGPDEDGTRRRVEEALRTAGVLDRVTFTGLLAGNDKLAAFSCADLFVLPSYSEGFSNAVIEALAAGLPVVISEQCNFPEVAEAEAGFVVPTEDASVSSAVRELLADAGLRERMGRNGRRLIMERYTWPAIAESMADLYRTLIGRRARP